MSGVRTSRRRSGLFPLKRAPRTTRSGVPRDPIIVRTRIILYIVFVVLFIIVINGHIITDKNLTAEGKYKVHIGTVYTGMHILFYNTMVTVCVIYYIVYYTIHRAGSRKNSALSKIKFCHS